MRALAALGLRMACALTIAGALACAESPPPAARTPGSQATARANESPPAAALRVLSRSAVRAAVAQGLGAFLQHVELDDEPVLASGRFHGFRIAALRGAEWWKGVDLAEGDVVTSVNGFPIERPEQAQTAFDSLAVASELRVAYERNGQPRELVLQIVDR
jgi:type II secretory pathway component PulC